jgi:hypothetical protein
MVDRRGKASGRYGVVRILGWLTIVGGLAFSAMSLSAMLESGQGGLGGVYAAFYAVALLVLAIPFLVGGVVLLVAVSAIRELPPDAPQSTTASRRLAGGAAILAAAAAIMPVVASVSVTSRYGSDQLMSESGVVVGFCLAIGVVSATAAWISRELPGRPLAVALLLVALVPTVIPIWTSSQIASSAANRAAADEWQEQPVETWHSDLVNGPTAGEVLSAVGTVGSWQPIWGGVHPYVRPDDYQPDQTAVLALADRSVRLVVLGQCQVFGWPGMLSIRLIILDGPEWNERFGKCDGTVQWVISDPIRLPAWRDGVAQSVREGSKFLIFGNVQGVPDESGEAWEDHAERFVVYISSDPATPIEPLRDAVVENAAVTIASGP